MNNIEDVKFKSFLNDLGDTPDEATIKLHDDLIKENIGLESEFELYNIMGYELATEAIEKDRNFIAHYYRRTRTFINYFGTEKNIGKYAEILTNVNPTAVSPKSSEQFLNLSNVEALNEIMNEVYVVNSLSEDDYAKDTREMGKRLEAASKLGALKGLPYGIGLIASMIGFFKVRNAANDAAGVLYEENKEYFKKITRIVEKMSAARGLSISVDGYFTKEQINQINSNINEVRFKIIPKKIRNQIRPDFLKTKQMVSYEDKKSIAKIAYEHSDIWRTALGGKSKNYLSGLNFILNSTNYLQATRLGSDSIKYPVDSLEQAYTELFMNLLMSYLDAMSALVLLVDDIRKY